MPKKFSFIDRKKMLERLEHGATETDLKRQFGITDNRTLQKQLKKAQEEQTIRVARIEIVKQSLVEHLSEIRSQIETWSSSIKSPSQPSFSDYVFRSLDETDRLFQAVRQHLPFADLWKAYKIFKEKWDDYYRTFDELDHQVVEMAKGKWGLDLVDDESRPGLTSSFSRKTINWAIMVAKGIHRVENPSYYAAVVGTETSDLEYLECDGKVILRSTEALRYADDHRSMIWDWASSEAVLRLAKLIDELRGLEMRIHDMLEEILLRRDYVLHTCTLCPGEGKPTFK